MLDNFTPFSAQSMPHVASAGMFEHIIVKLGYDIRRLGGSQGLSQLDLASSQPPLLETDVYEGEELLTELLYEQDYAPLKPATDVIVCGHAYAPGNQPIRRFEAAIQVRDRTLPLTLHCPRRWVARSGMEKAASLFMSSDVQIEYGPPVTSVALSWHLAFGGYDDSDVKTEHHSVFDNNPVGRGYHANGASDSFSDVLLPQIEHPDRMVRNWYDKPLPVCTAVYPKHFGLRRALAGTCDEAWQRQTAPLPPEDFSMRFYNCAAPELQFAPYLQAGERIYLHGFVSGGEPLTIQIPQPDLYVLSQYGSAGFRSNLNLDTIVIEPDKDRCSLVWKTALPPRHERGVLSKIGLFRQ